ncbi:MAG TPA: hypothetical protein PLH57_03030, partial [Oligoflexia bacterium]|nr:hypothetical protein [Oligoflexia bacterium]
WFLISFGPATWGTFLTSLPFATNMHWHRAFLMFQITLAACTGIAFVSFLSALNKVFTEKINPPQPQYWTAGIAATLVSLVFAGPLVERHRYFYKTNAHWLSESKKSWTDNLASQDLLRFAQSKTGTRFYAGTHPNVLPGSWGNDLRVTTYIPVYGLFAQHNVESVGPIYHHQNHTEDASFRYLWKSKAHNELFNIGYLVANDKQTMPPEFKNTNKFGSASVYTTGIQENYFAFAKIFPENAFLPDAALPCADNAGLVRATLEFLFSRLPETGQFPAFQLQRRCRTSNELDQFLKDLKKSSDVPPKGQFTAAGRATGKSSYNYWAEGQNETATALVFKMNFHPLWSLKINGVEVEKRLVSPALIAVPIPAGHFRIEAEYQPGRLRLIFATLTLAFGGVLIALRRRTALAGIW